MRNEISLDRWKRAQQGEAAWWWNWLQQHDNDDRWHSLLFGYFSLDPDQASFEEKTVVDVGCGPMGILPKLRASVRIGIDPLPLSCLSVDPSIVRLKAMGEALPLRNSTADGVFVYNVLQHVLSPSGVLDEAYRILKTTGSLYLFEQLDIPTSELHPHVVTEELFDDWMARCEVDIVKKMVERCLIVDEEPPQKVICLVLQKPEKVRST